MLNTQLLKHARCGAPSMFAIVDDGKKIFKNWRGTRICRWRHVVGKAMGGGIYVHKQYAHMVIPEDILDAAEKIKDAKCPGFSYNCIHYKANRVRFDEAPDFDTASEPTVGRMLTVDVSTEKYKLSSSDLIWHHKWLWVMDDYTGFDVSESYEWSKAWSKEISSPPGVRSDWEQIIKQCLTKN